MKTAVDPSALEVQLEASWKSVLRIPDDDDSFDRLSPSQRRRAHDLGVRIQDRLTRALARLVVGMVDDGAELVDTEGLPLAMKQAPSRTDEPT